MRPILFLIVISSLLWAESKTQKLNNKSVSKLSDKNTIKLAKAMGFGGLTPKEVDLTKDSIPSSHILAVDTSKLSIKVDKQFEYLWKSILENDIELWSASTGIDSTQKIYKKYQKVIPKYSNKLKSMDFTPPKILSIYSRNNVFLLVVEENFSEKRITESFAFKIGEDVYVTDEALRRNPTYDIGSNFQDMNWLFKYWRKHRKEIKQDLESK